MSIKELFNTVDYCEFCKQLEDCTSEELALIEQAVAEARLQKANEEEEEFSFADFEDEDDFDDCEPYEDFYDDEVGYNPYDGCYDADL